MNQTGKDALQYIRNTGGGATKEAFIEDHEPIGHLLWEEVKSHVTIEDGKLFVNEESL